MPRLSLTSPQVSHRLASRPWHEKDGKLRELEARTLLDTFYIQVGQAREGASEPEGFSSLAPWTPPALDSKLSPRTYLGEAICLCAEVEKNLSEDELTKLAVAIVRKGIARSVKQEAVEGICLPFGFFVLLPNIKPATAVLLYSESGTQGASRFVHFVLPQLLLSRLKAWAIADAYQKLLLPRAHKQEQTLDALLKQAAEPHLPLETLEQLSAEISREQAVFIEGISTLEEQLQTLRVCVRNVELLLSEPLWGKQRHWAEQQLTGDIALLVEQMETDLRYLRITQQQADLVLQSLLTITGVRGTHWERRTALILSIFTVVAAAQVFPELGWWRFAVIGLGSIIVGLSYWWLRKH